MFRRLNRIVLQPHWLHFESESATLTPLAASQYMALKSEPATLFLADGGSLVIMTYFLVFSSRFLDKQRPLPLDSIPPRRHRPRMRACLERDFFMKRREERRRRRRRRRRRGRRRSRPGRPSIAPSSETFRPRPGELGPWAK